MRRTVGFIFLVLTLGDSLFPDDARISCIMLDADLDITVVP